MDDTAVAATTLPNGKSASLFPGRVWQIPPRALLFPSRNLADIHGFADGNPLFKNQDRKNNTPLAAATWRNSKNGNDIVSLFYVAPVYNPLQCAHWELNKIEASDLDLSKITLAPDSRQVSATWLLKNDTHRSSVLLIYQEPSHQLVISRASPERDAEGKLSFTWSNDTDRFNSALTEYRRTITYESLADPPDAYLADWCITVPLSDQDLFERTESPLLYKSNIAEFIFDINSTTGNISIYNSSIIYYQSISFATNSESALMSTGINSLLAQSAESRATESANRIWFMAPVPQSLTVDGRPSPNAPFPFQRLSTTSATNTTKTYLYHQINDSTIGEEYWDGTSGFWLSNNLTTDVSED
ncbi:MAG: hypothetical protein Q9226_009177 [Calogaya cf. arnoldii]